ncbi:peptide/nickel transport system substrate-binding protein [Microbacterium trichothecenolyticum]|uniref:ABC transporter substrate-binding protein n=1 Tax=Microbacterium trichothecenolyticum TaxID=69370 RepID=UPI00286521FC|nr:ABC transporter substrate-binding protein [Microbacterium trichothecenolyticum]MDR7111104.1 peptide/nickel transport system substrate-binding protein [Microbacterium trichothecenolyticum]
MIRTRRTRRLLAFAGIGVAGALVLSACSADTSSPDATAAPEWEYTAQTAAPSGDIDSYSWVSYSEPYSLDYAYAFDYADNQVLANVCESLLRLNPDFTLSPGLAEAFEHPTPETWVYTIRDGVTFHDGTPLTAADAVASLSRHLDPEVGSSWYSVYQNVASIEQTGDREVTVTMNGPDSQFNLAMGGSAGVVESAATLTEKGADYGNSTGLVNCTGPFALTEWKSGESVTLTRYDDYWDDTLRARAGEVDILFMTDPNARVNALKSGEVDGGWMIPADAIGQLQDSGKGDMYFGLNTAVGSLIVNNLEGPLGDERVRRALLMAMDRQGILDAAAQGYGEVTNALTTESVWVGASGAGLKEAFEGLEEYPYDVEAAKRLIDEAGVAGEEIVIATAPISNDFAVISQGAAAAAQSIGLTATIETVSPSAYTALFSDPTAREGIDLFYTSWYLSSPDPLEMYSVLRTGEFSNYGNWSDPEFDALVNEAVTIDDPAARSEVTAQAQRIANEQLPWLPLFQGPMTLFLGDRVTGVAPSVAFMYYPWAATIGSR